MCHEEFLTGRAWRCHFDESEACVGRVFLRGPESGARPIERGEVYALPSTYRSNSGGGGADDVSESIGAHPKAGALALEPHPSGRH
ncbi:MAG: hypothetical protein ACI8QC_004324 [Planctomycetota bacterium]